MRDLAERLIGEETRGRKSPEAPLAISVIIDKLRPHLQMLMGKMGYRALLARTLAQVSTEFSWLRALHVQSDGSLAGLSQPELESHVDPGTIANGRAALLTYLLESLTAFVGANVTLQLVRNIWPNILLDDLDSAKGKGK